MISRGSIRLSKSLERNLKERIEVYEFEVGILRDRPHYDALPAEEGFKNYASMRNRKTSRKSSQSVAQVAAKARQSTGINYLVSPFRIKSDDAVKMIDNFLNMVFDPNPASKQRRLENLIQAVVRNPIMRGDYGKNPRSTVIIKGFNKLLVDTGQLFRAIQARVKKVARKNV